MVRAVLSSLLVMAATLSPHAQAAATADADLWTTAAADLRRGLFGQDRGELVIVNQTIPTSELPSLPSSTREPYLLDLLRQRNDSTRKPLKGVRLPPRARLLPAGSVPTLENFSKMFPAGEKLVRFSLPAFSGDGMRAILYYWATGGFDDSQGGYLVFEKKQGHWTTVDAFGIWIT